MTDAPDPKAEPESQAKAAAPRRSSPVVPIAVLAGALLAGAAAGGFLVAPMMTRPPAAATGEEDADHAEKSSGGHEKKKGEEKRLVYRVENVIVNPAGSQGVHFLMASVAFEVPNERVESQLRDRDAEVRDLVIATLESETLDALMQPGARERIKQQLLTAIRRVAGKRTPVKVYLPQFVVQ